MKEKDNEKIPTHLKLNLTLKEAAEYSNIGINRLSIMVSEPDCPFALFVGNKKLIKRKVFEEYLNSESIHYIWFWWGRVIKLSWLNLHTTFHYIKERVINYGTEKRFKR